MRGMMAAEGKLVLRTDCTYSAAATQVGTSVGGAWTSTESKTSTMATCFDTCWCAPTRDTGLPVYMRAEGVTAESGPRFQIFDPYDAGKGLLATKNVIGTSEWAEQRLECKTAADPRLLLIRIARPPSGKFDNKITGTVWIDGVRLTEED